MKRASIIVVAAIFLAEVGLLIAGTPRPAGTRVASATLSVGGDNQGLVLVLDRKAEQKAHQAEAGAEEAIEGGGATDILKTPPKDEKPGREIIEIAYVGDRWRIRKPIEFAASGPEVNRIVEALRDLRMTAVASRSAETRRRLQVDDENGIRVTLSKDDVPAVDLIVGVTDLEGRTFIRKHGEEAIWTVEGLRRDDLARPLDELRDKQVFDAEPGDVVALTIRRGQGERSFAKEGETWKLQPPDEMWVLDSSKVSGAVSSLARLRATGFGDGLDVETTGLGGIFAAAIVTFTVQPEGKAAVQHRLLVGNKDAEGHNYYVAREEEEGLSAVYIVSKYTIERIIGSEEAQLDDYREKRVVRDVTADKVKAVTVSIGGYAVTFEKGAGTDEWKPAAGAPFAEADGSTISEVVRKLVALRAADFVGVPPLAFGGQPVTLRDLIEDLPVTIRRAMNDAAQAGSVGELEIVNILTRNLQFLEQMARLYAVIYPTPAPAVGEELRRLAGELHGTFVALRDPLLVLAAKLSMPSGGVAVDWTLTLQDDTSLTVSLGGILRDGKRPVRTTAEGDRQIYAVAGDQLGDVAIESLNDLRKSKPLATIPADRVTSIVFADAVRQWEFTRPIGGEWAQGRRTTIERFEPAKVDEVLRRVLDVAAVKFVATPRETAGLTAPTATVRITWLPEPPAAEEGAPRPPPPARQVVLVAVGLVDPDGQRYAGVSGDGVDDLLASSVFTVGAAAAADLTPEASAFAETAEEQAPAELTPGEDLGRILGGTGAPAPEASVPAPAPAPAPGVAPSPAAAPAPVVDRAAAHAHVAAPAAPAPAAASAPRPAPPPADPYADL